MVLGKKGILPVAIRFCEGIGEFFVIDVGDSFEEQQREDKCLEISSVHRPAEDVRRFPKVIGELIELKPVVVHCRLLFKGKSRSSASPVVVRPAANVHRTEKR